MDRFIKVVCDDDFSQLFINPKDYVLTKPVIEIWEAIHEAFLDGMADKAGLHKLKLTGKINNLEFNYRLIQLCVKYLSVAYDREIIGYLSKIVRVGEFNPEDMKSYMNDLQVVLNRAKQILVEIEEKNAELSIIQKPVKPGEKTTRKQFDQLITQVSIYAKFHIDKKEVTVSEFIEYYASMRETSEAMEEQYEKSKR